jgi:CheY-like chemotaxis protein
LEALDIFVKDPSVFDLVITDMTMPGMNGKSLAKELRKTRPDIPVIPCTGFSDQISGSIAEMGVQALLMKPITLENLSETIRKVLDEGNSKMK